MSHDSSSHGFHQVLTWVEQCSSFEHHAFGKISTTPVWLRVFLSFVQMSYSHLKTKQWNSGFARSKTGVSSEEVGISEPLRSIVAPWPSLSSWFQRSSAHAPFPTFFAFESFCNSDRNLERDSKSTPGCSSSAWQRLALLLLSGH